MTISKTIAYFGYGSLVNLATLRTPYISAHRARLSGWRRRWLSRPKVEGSFAPDDNLAFLSVEPSTETVIDGMVIVDHRTSLEALDEREVLYDRNSVNCGMVEFPDGDPLEPGTELFLYVAQEPPAGPQAQILQSYLDAVMQGYHVHFGEKGVEDFMATTANFDCPILADRDAPLYPRSVLLSTTEQQLFDAHMRA